MRAAIILLVAIAIAGCKTTNSDQWTGTGIKPYRQAEKTCLEQTRFIADDAARRDFFIGCMGAFGWSPRPGAQIDL